MNITSRSNATIQHIKKLLSSGTYRKECGLFVGDGHKLLGVALDCGFPLVQILYTGNPPEIPDGYVGTKNLEILEIPDSLMSYLSPMKTPQGVLFVGEIPENPLPSLLPSGEYLLLDGVQDPGNVGSIWRTVQGLGISGLVLLEGCASPWNPKTVRSSMGACFHVPIYQSTGKELVALCDKSQIPLCGTCLQGDSQSLAEVSLENVAVILGSEGRGVSPELLLACEQTIYLPMSSCCESLNVATVASIVVWEMAKKRMDTERIVEQ